MSEMRGPADYREKASIYRQAAEATRAHARRKKRKGEREPAINSTMLLFAAGLMEIIALLADRRDQDWINYHAAGSPYGSTYQGLWRWLHGSR